MNTNLTIFFDLILIRSKHDQCKVILNIDIKYKPKASSKHAILSLKSITHPIIFQIITKRVNNKTKIPEV